jgi:hypothetical protein
MSNRDLSGTCQEYMIGKAWFMSGLKEIEETDTGPFIGPMLQILNARAR